MKKFLTLIPIILFSIAGFAQNTLNIHQKDGEIFCCGFLDKPIVTYEGNTLKVSRRTRQTLWSAVQMLTQKLCCQTIHDCPKVVPLHYESE